MNKKKSIIAHLGLFDRYSLAFFLSSIIPLAVLVFISYQFIFPELEDSGRTTFGISLRILMFLLVFLSILAFFVSRAATREIVEKLQLNNEKLRNVFVIAESMSRESFLDVLLETVVKRAIELTGASAGLALIRNEETGELVFEVALGTGTMSTRSVPDNTGIAGWVLKHQKAVIIDDVSKDDRYNPEVDVMPNFATQSILSVPLASGGKVFGVLELLKHTGQEGFTEDDANLLKCLAGQTSIFIHNVEYHQQQQNYFTHMTELLLSALEGTRQFWPGHLTNTARYANLIARHLGFSDPDLKQLHYAALLHDIGFIKINLQEGSPRKLIEHHPEIGYEMIHPITLWKDVAPAIKHHHERYDGNGYPAKIAGDQIPMNSRILAVAETLDVLCNPKSYKKKNLSYAEAFKEILAYSGSQFDPVVVDALQKVIESNQLT
ncbi:GAF domain-containing protein [bacterium]|nr:GAF domain-containing protein [candidate division CSSED10-310 bacterium]